MSSLLRFIPGALRTAAPLPRIPNQYAHAKISDEHLYGPYALRSAKNMREFKDQVLCGTRACVKDLRKLATDGVKAPEDAAMALSRVDCLSNLLCLILDPLDLFLATNTTSNDPEFLETANDIFLEVSAEMAQLNTETFFWDALSPIESTPALFNSLGPEQQYLVKAQVRDLSAGGIHLPREDRDKLVELSNESTAASRRFQEEYGTGHPASFGSSKQGALLEDISNTLQLRHEMTSLLKHRTFAEATLEVTAARSASNAVEFLARVGRGMQPLLASEKTKLGVSNKAMNLMELEYALYNASPQTGQLGVSFEVALEALRETLSRVFKLDVVEVEMTENETRWGFRGLRKFFFFDATREAADQFLGTMYIDPFARSGKSDGAGHYTLQVGCDVHAHQAAIPSLASQGPRQKPIIMLSFCFRHPSSLVTEEVETLFHEAGHAVHSMVGQCSSQQYSGTRATLDFCEFPSQLLELYPRQWDVVTQFGGAYSAHVKKYFTQDSFERNLGHRAAYPAAAVLQQVAQAVFDLTIHHVPPSANVYEFPSAQAVDGDDSPSAMIQVPRSAPVTEVYKAVVKDYLATYYSYLYSNAYVRLVWTRLLKQNPLSSVHGRRLVDEVLYLGGACCPNEVLAKYLKTGAELTPKELADVILKNPFI